MKTYIIKGLVILTICSAVTRMSAQQSYGIGDCRRLALENNIRMRNVDNSLKAAQQAEREAFTKYFPSVSATGMGFAANKGLLQMDMGEGMEMSLMKNGIMGGVTISQPVFAGGQIVNANRLAKVGIETSNIQKDASENEVLMTVEKYFWQIITLQEKLKTITQVEKQLESICKDVTMAVEAGITTRNDLLQIQLHQGDMESKRISFENALTVCRMLLAQYVGLASEDFILNAEVNIDSVPPLPQHLLVSHDAALPQTTSYRLLQQNVEASNLQKRLAVGKNLPTVAVGAGYMYDNLMDSDHPFALGFVSVSVPLSGWWGGSHAIKKEKLNVMNAENLMRDQSEQLVIGMQQSWNDLSDAHKKMLIARKSIEQSAENLRLNEDYYRAGTTTMSDLLDAQTLFQQSRDNYVETFADFKVKAVEYLQATGRNAQDY